MSDFTIPLLVAAMKMPKSGKAYEQLVVRVGSSWRSLGSMLGVEPYVLGYIDDEHRKLADKVAALMQHLRELHVEAFTVGLVASALDQMSRRDVAEKFVEDMTPPSQ